MIKAFKDCISGVKTKEITTEYVMDEDTNQLKIAKQKVQEKVLPPNIDLLKLIYQQISETKTNYEDFTDEQLIKEKERLLKLLKETEDGSNKSKNKS